MRPTTAGSGGTRLPGWLRPPVLPDPDEARIAATVHLLSLSFIAAAVAWTIISFFVLWRPWTVFPITLTLVACLIAALVLARRGRTRPAARVLVGGLFVGTTWAVAISGVSAPPISTYLVVILAAGLLIGVRAAIVATAASALATVALAAMDTRGLLLAVVPHNPWSTIAVELSLFAATAVLLTDALRRVGLAIRRAERGEARARELFEQASDAIIVIEPDGRIAEANARAAELAGYPGEDPTGFQLSDFISGEDLTDSLRLLGAIGTGKPLMRERRMRRRDGTRFDIETSFVRLSDGRVQTVFRDVTARKRAEQMQERLRNALEEAGEGVALFDQTGKLLYMNRVFRESFDEGGRLRLDMSADELPTSRQERELTARVQAEIAAGRRYSARLERRRPDGSLAIYHMGFTPVRDAAGGPAGSVAITRDVTREVALESSLQVTRKLDTIGKLAGGLAHDFNNLLTVILGSAESLRGTAAPQDEVDEILEAGQRAAALTTKLLAFSRDQAVRVRRLDLSELVRDAVGMLQRLVRENITIQLDLAPEPMWVEADPSQLHQVLVNLAANARDAMAEGGRLEIATQAIQLSRLNRPVGVRLPDGPYVVLGVRDTGVGMSEAVQERLFEPFFTTKQPGRGTGLGLASVSAIIQQAKGAIEVTSQLGKGTLLRVFLPRALAPEPTAERRASTAARRRPQGARILVVEDEAMLLRLVSRSLEACGHRVSTARDGHEALDLALTDPPDVLVTDVILPGLDGGELTRRLRERHPRIPVLFTSGYAPEAITAKIVENGFTVFLPKPFTMEDLLSTVDRLLERRAEK